MFTLKLELTLSKQTKNKNVYGDVTEGAAIPSVYIEKSAFPNGPPPQTIKVTVEIPE